jgi:hypothetical protein
MFIPDKAKSVLPRFGGEHKTIKAWQTARKKQQPCAKSIPEGISGDKIA